MGLGDPDGGHAGGGGGLDADVGVLEDQAVFRVDAETLGGQEEGVGGGLGVGVVAGADQGVEEVEDAEGFQRADDGLAGAAGDYCEGNVAVLEVNLIEDLGDRAELIDEAIVEALLAVGEFLDGDREAIAAVELGDYGVDGATTPGVEEFLGEGGAAVLAEGLGPGDEVDGHGVGDGAVTVEEVGLEVACGERESHRCLVYLEQRGFNRSAIRERSPLRTLPADFGRRYSKTPLVPDSKGSIPRSQQAYCRSLSGSRPRSSRGAMSLQWDRT